MSKTEEEKAFISECQANANWLIKSLEQRQRTIYKVAESLVRHQRDFLDKGMDVNAKDKEGSTALTYAKQAKKQDIEEILIKAGAAPVKEPEAKKVVAAIAIIEEMKAGKVALRVRDGSQEKDQDLGAIVARVQDRIRRRAPEL